MTTIAIVARHYWPDVGAASIRLGTLAAVAVARGHEVHVITRRHAQLMEPTRGPAGETVVPVRGDSVTGVSARRAGDLARFAISAHSVLRSRVSADLLLSDPPPTSGLATALAARHHGSPWAYYLADSWAQMVHGTSMRRHGMGAAVQALESGSLRRADLVLAVTPRLREYAVGQSARQVTLVENGADLETFTPSGPVWADPWQGAVPYLLYAGNYGVVHGASVFASAAEVLWRRGATFGLVYMGYGTDQATIEQAAQRWPGRLVLLPPASAQTAASAFRGAQAGLASIRPLAVTEDARPAKALASVACGCPLLYAGSGTFARQVAAARLGVTTTWDVDAVVTAMDQALQNPRTDEETARLRAYGTQHFDQRAAATRALDDMTSLL